MLQNQIEEEDLSLAMLYPDLRRYALRRVLQCRRGCDADAEDLLHDALLRQLQCAPHFPIPAAPDIQHAIQKRIAGLWRDRVKSAACRRRIESLASVVPGDEQHHPPGADPTRSLAETDLREVLARLPLPTRRLLLGWAGGCTGRDLADLQGMATSAAARQRVARALAKLTVHRRPLLAVPSPAFSSTSP